MPRPVKKRNPFYAPYQAHETGLKIPRFDIDVSVSHIKGYKMKKFKHKGNVNPNASQEWKSK